MSLTDLKLSTPRNTAQDVTGFLRSPSSNAQINNERFDLLVKNVMRSPYNALVEALHEMFVGAVFAYACSTAPDGMLKCDGSAVSRTAYARLFGRIGEFYGAGDGVTTFNLPNIKGRTIIGAGTADSGTVFTVGATGGEETVSLTGAQNGPHNHTIYTGDNGYSIGYGGVASGGEAGIVRDSTIDRIVAGYSGNGEAHNNMPPYVVLNFFIVY